MKCNNCGAEINEWYRLCPKCGAKTKGKGISSIKGRVNKNINVKYSHLQK